MEFEGLYKLFDFVIHWLPSELSSFDQCIVFHIVATIDGIKKGYLSNP
jgi:hypothetical protein